MSTETLMPYATLLGFTRYVTRTGPAKADFVGGLRRQRARRSGFNPHGPLIKALKSDIEFRTPGSHLAKLTETVNPRWRPLYEALIPGATAYLHSLGDLSACWLVPPHQCLAMVGSLPVKINPQLGLRFDGGRAEAVRLHFDEDPPTEESVLATLHLMARHMDQLLPGAEPVVVDVRRAQVHRGAPPGEPDGSGSVEQHRATRVEQWLTGEAVAFASMWSAAA